MRQWQPNRPKLQQPRRARIHYAPRYIHVRDSIAIQQQLAGPIEVKEGKKTDQAGDNCEGAIVRRRLNGRRFHVNGAWKLPPRCFVRTSQGE